jgi:hypothetical protein
MSEIVFSSVLSRSYYQDLQNLLFFNVNQGRIAADLVRMVERYGAPRVQVVHDRLRVVTDSLTPVQTLFVLDGESSAARLIGVIVYTREADTLTALYCAVQHDYCASRGEGEQPLLLRIVSELCKVGRRIKGVRSVTLLLRGVTRRLEIR